MVQTVVGLMLDATVIGVVFQKLANANARANTARRLKESPALQNFTNCLSIFLLL